MSKATVLSPKNLVFTNKSVACFSPHPDDTSISAGATLSFLSQKNTVSSCVCTTGHRAHIPNTVTDEERTKIRESEANEEAKILGITVEFLRLPLYSNSNKIIKEDVDIIKSFLQRNKVEVIIMPHTGDSHSTHRACVKAILMAVREILQEDTTNEINFETLMYEGPWSLFSPGSYNFIVSPPDETFNLKLKAIQAHKSQTVRTAYDRAADCLATMRGILIPESDLAGFGSEPPHLSDRLELFFHINLSSPNIVDEFLKLAEKNKPPRVK